MLYISVKDYILEGADILRPRTLLCPMLVTPETVGLFPGIIVYQMNNVASDCLLDWSL